MYTATRRHTTYLLIFSLCAGLLLFIGGKPAHAFADTALNELEDTPSQWGIYQDQGSVTGSLTTVNQPSLDGSALKVSLLGGQPYAGLHAYRNLPSADTAHAFQLSLSYFFSQQAAIQALEFTMNTWVNNQRWEWALQWEKVGDGSSQQGQPPTWRIWTGTNWQDTGIQQQLLDSSWHSLYLSGEILNNQVHYLSFTSDGITAYPGQAIFAPVFSPGDKLAVGVQLDGNYQEQPYDLFLDHVDLSWQ